MMNDVMYAPFDTKQVDYLTKSFESWLNVAEGGKRAGKNILNIIAFADNIETHPDRIHLAAGVTKASAMMNIIDSNGFGLQHYFKGRCSTGKFMKMECLYVNTATGQKIVIIAGGKDADSFTYIKGNSYGSVYVTEANECHQSFIQEVFDRTLASTRRQIFFDINPKPPNHWFYKDILDYQDELADIGENPYYNFAHFTLWNNRSLSDELISNEVAKYDKTSMWYQADILGKRMASTGRIYTGYKKVDISRKSRQIQDLGLIRYSIGVDVGGTDATVATLTGFSKNYENVALVDGYYHKQGISHGMTHDKYAKAIFDKIDMWIEMYPMVETATIFAESADKLFRQALENERVKRHLHRMQIIPTYKKDGILDRIRLNQILINQGRFFIARHMKSWFEAYENAVWDDEEYEKGEWVRVDDGSYPVDCLDSTEYSIQPYKPQLIKGGS